MGLLRTDESPNLGQKTKNKNHLISVRRQKTKNHLISVRRQSTTKKKKKKKKKKKICKVVDFVVLADHRIKLKDCEKKNKYLDLARELKKLWNMKVTIMPIIIGAFCTLTEGLLK